MNNHLTLSAILVVVFAFTAQATKSYDDTLSGPDYVRARGLVQKAQTDNETLNGIIRMLGNNNTVRLFAIHRLIDLRCQRYLHKADADLCGEAALKMLKNLDFDVRFLESSRKGMPAFVFVAFQTKLIELLNDESTGAYLELLARKFEDQAFNSVRLFNLWDETLSYYKGDKLRAVMMLAVLFQDTSAAQIHLEYLARRHVEGSRFFNPNVSRLARVIDLMVRLQSEQPQLFKQLAYPDNKGASFNNGIYHFYVPWYLSAQLKAQGEQVRYAGIAPWMLTLTYEFITSSPDYRHLIWDPQSIQETWTMRDIFAGLNGTARGSERRQPLPSFTRLEELLHQNTASAVQDVLKGF